MQNADLEELLVVLGVQFDIGLELLVPDKCHVGGQHHERLACLVLILQGPIPLLLVPARISPAMSPSPIFAYSMP